MKMDTTFLRLKSRTDDAEWQVKALYEKFNGLNSVCNGRNADKPEEMSPELAALITTNIKLKHRLAVLKRAIEEEKQKKPMTMKSNASDSTIMESSMQETLVALFTAAIHTAFPDLPDPPITVVPSQAPFGDYQCNSAMAIAQILKGQGVKISPQDVGSRIRDAVAPSKLVSKYEVAGPGYVNIWLSRDYGHEVLTKLIIQGVKPPPLHTKHRVLVDFSSPNIAKEMHVGHLRSTIIGESLCRLLEFLGHEVMRINHIGDWGTQFGMLIAHLQEKFPDYLSVSPPIADLQAFYKESKARFDSDENFKKRAYSCVVKLQAFHPEYTQAWQRICDVSRKEFQKVYDRLNVTLTERGESFYQKHMESLVKELEQKGFLQEDEGRKVMFGLKEGKIPMTIVKSDGGFTYDTSDMAAIKYRIEQDKADWIIYVTDAGQAVHFQVLMSCAERAGILDPKKVRVDHVGFGVVRGEDKKKFKTRSGETVRLTDLLDEGLKRALDTLKLKKRHEVLTSEEFKAAQEAVAYGCIKYADLVHHRNNDYIFSFDKMLDDKGNTAVYMLYMYVRIASIVRIANANQLHEAARTVPLSLDHEKEWKLAILLLRFNDVLAVTTRDLSLHHLCEFLFDVACAFSEFYDKCYCIEKDSANGEIKKIHMGRILLCEATKLVMAKVFYILSLDPVARM